MHFLRLTPRAWVDIDMSWIVWEWSRLHSIADLAVKHSDSADTGVVRYANSTLRIIGPGGYLRGKKDQLYNKQAGATWIVVFIDLGRSINTTGRMIWTKSVFFRYARVFSAYQAFCFDSNSRNGESRNRCISMEQGVLTCPAHLVPCRFESLKSYLGCGSESLSLMSVEARGS